MLVDLLFLYGVVCGQVCRDVSVSCNGTSVSSARLNACLPLFAPACVRVIIVKCGVLMQSRRAGVLLFHCFVSEEVRDLLHRQIRIFKKKSDCESTKKPTDAVGDINKASFYWLPFRCSASKCELRNSALWLPWWTSPVLPVKKLNDKFVCQHHSESSAEKWIACFSK